MQQQTGERERKERLCGLHDMVFGEQGRRETPDAWCMGVCVCV